MNNSSNYVKLSIFIGCILVVFTKFSFANQPDLKNESLDSILQWMYQNVETDTVYAHGIGLMGLQKAFQHQDDLMIGDFHDIVAYWHDYHKKFSNDSVVYHYTGSLQAYKLSDSVHYVPIAQLDLATAYMNNDEYEKARVLTFKAIKILEASGDRVELAGAYNALANLHLITDESEECIKYGLMSRNEFEKLNNYPRLINSSLALMNCLCQKKDFISAHEYGSKNIELTNKYIPDQLGFIVRSLDVMSMSSIGLKKYDRAFAEANELWKIAENAVGARQAAGYKGVLAEVYFAKGEYKEAIEIFEFIVDNVGSKNEQWEMYNKMATCYSKLGEFDKALRSKNVAFLKREGILNDKVSKLKSESFVKYETGKKDQELSSQELQLQQKTKIQTLSYGIGSLLLMMLGGLFFSFRRNKKFTQALQEKNDENELLLKEIHHRVKNNLETVSALLTLQGAQVEDENAKMAMKASQSRVEAMGLLHQKLYQGTNLGSIEMKDYFVNLSEGVLDSFYREDQVKIELAMDQLELDIDTAVPIGLIVNELLTNAMKYAFPPEYDARIKIILKEIDHDQLLLEVADNGIGIDVNKAPIGTGFGTQLVNLLTRQLRGKIDKKVNNGTIISLILKKTKAA